MLFFIQLSGILVAVTALLIAWSGRVSSNVDPLYSTRRH